MNIIVKHYDVILTFKTHSKSRMLKYEIVAEMLRQNFTSFSCNVQRKMIKNHLFYSKATKCSLHTLKNADNHEQPYTHTNFD